SPPAWSRMWPSGAATSRRTSPRLCPADWSTDCAATPADPTCFATRGVRGSSFVEGMIDAARTAACAPRITGQDGETCTVDPMDRIDEIISVVETARNVPMSRNCMLDRGELLGLLEHLRSEFPAEIRRASALLDERDKILDAGQREAERMISEAEAE